MKVNVNIPSPLVSFIVGLRHIKHKELDSRMIGIDEVKNILLDNKNGNFEVTFGENFLTMNQSETLGFLDKNFGKLEGSDSVAKYRSFETPKGNVNYLWLYRNNVDLQNKDEIRFATYMTPLRGRIAYFG